MVARVELRSASVGGPGRVLLGRLRSIVGVGYHWYSYAYGHVRPNVDAHRHVYGVSVFVFACVLGANLYGFAVFYGLAYLYGRALWNRVRSADRAISGDVARGVPARRWLDRFPARRAADKRVG